MTDKTNSTQYIDTNAIIPFPVKVVSVTSKAVGFYTEVDGVTRWIPKSALIDPDFYELGKRYMIHIRLWRLKKRDGTYPAWAVAQVGGA